MMWCFETVFDVFNMRWLLLWDNMWTWCGNFVKKSLLMIK